jgi:flagellar biosynthesis/type III secretory pathway protein FliH
MGRDTQVELPAAPSALMTAADIIQAAEARAAAIVAAAEVEGAARTARAQSEADAIRTAAYSDGFAAGQAQGTAEVESCAAVARQAAAEGKAIRDQIASQAALVVARAVSLAVRRVVGEYYAEEPARTAAICNEALRAAAGQEVLSVRIHPDIAEAVQSSLVDGARYVRPDASVEIGGCIIDVRNGTIDATLDARLSLLDLALEQAAA